MKEQVKVMNFILCERPDGTRCLSISSRAKEMDLEFAPEAWAKLAEDARWFHANVSTVQKVTTSPETPAAIEKKENE